jgi:hypothetical protein
MSKRSAEANNGDASNKRQATTAPREDKDDELSASLRCLLSRPFASKDLAAVTAAASSGHAKLHVNAFFKQNKRKVLDALLSLVEDHAADASDRENGFDLLRDSFSDEGRVFDAAWSALTAPFGDGALQNWKIRIGALQCAMANAAFAGKLGPLLDQLQSMVNEQLQSTVTLSEGQEALRVCTVNYELNGTATLLSRDLEEAAQTIARRLLESKLPDQQVDGLNYLLSVSRCDGDFGVEEDIVIKRIAFLFTSSTDALVSIFSCESLSNWSVLDELSKTEPGVGAIRAMLDKLASTKDNSVAKQVMTTLSDLCSDTLNDYLDGTEGAESIEKAIKELVETRGVDLVFSWLTKSKSLVPACLSLLSSFCSAGSCVCSSNATQNIWVGWLKDTKFSPPLCLTLGPGSDDTDRIVFVRSSRLLVDIVFGSECKAARLEQLMQKGYLRLMFDVLGPTKNKPQAPLEEEGQGECAVADCVAAVLAAFKATLDMSSTTSSFAKHMVSPQSLTVFLKLCSSNDEGTEAEASSLLQSMIHQCDPPSRTASRAAYSAVGGADMRLLDRIHAAACARLDAIPLPLPELTSGESPLTAGKGGLLSALQLLLAVWKRSSDHRRNFSHFHTVLLVFQSVGWSTLGQDPWCAPGEAILSPCTEIINHMLGGGPFGSSMEQDFAASQAGQFKISCLLEPGVVPLLTFVAADKSRYHACTQAASALNSLESWVKDDTTALGVLNSIHAMGGCGYGTSGGRGGGDAGGDVSGDAGARLPVKDNLLVSLALLLGGGSNRDLVLRMAQLGLMDVLKGLLSLDTGSTRASSSGAGGGGSSSSSSSSAAGGSGVLAAWPGSGERSGTDALKRVSTGCAVMSTLVRQTDLARAPAGCDGAGDGPSNGPSKSSRGQGAARRSARPASASRGMKASRGRGAAKPTTYSSSVQASDKTRKRLGQESRVERASCAAFAHMLHDTSLVDVLLEVEAGGRAGEEEQDAAGGEKAGEEGAHTALAKPGPTAGGGFIFEAHRFVLVARSEYFRRMLSSTMLEAREKAIKITGVSPLAMRGLLEFLYSGNVTDARVFGLDPKVKEEHEQHTDEEAEETAAKQKKANGRKQKSSPSTAPSSTDVGCESTALTEDDGLCCSSLYADADQELLVLANRYQTDGLKALTEKRLLHKMDARGKKAVAGILQTVIFASTHEAHTLKTEAVRFLVHSMTKYTPSKDGKYLQSMLQGVDAGGEAGGEAGVQLPEAEGEAMQLEAEGAVDESTGQEVGAKPHSKSKGSSPSVAQVWLEADLAGRAEVLDEVIFHLRTRLSDGVGLAGVFRNEDGAGGGAGDNPLLKKDGHVYCPSGHAMDWSNRSDGGYASGWHCDACGDRGGMGFHAARFCCNDCQIDYCKLCHTSFTTKPNPFVVTDADDVDNVLANAGLVADDAAPESRECPACTYYNPTDATMCEGCGTGL